MEHVEGVENMGKWVAHWEWVLCVCSIGRGC